MRFHPSRTLLALLTLAGLGGAQVGLDARRDNVRALYRSSSWEMGTLRDGFALGALELPGLFGGDVRPRGAEIERAFRLAGDPDSAGPALIVRARVEETAEAAHERLVDWLASLSSASAVPEDRLYGTELGQAGFVGKSGAASAAVSWAAFVQGNVFVRVRNVDPRATPWMPVVALAAVADRAIVARTPHAAGAKVPRPEIARLSTPAAFAIAGRPVPLDVTVVDPQGGEPVLEFHLAGEGQGYVERRLDGWTLFPTGAGRLTVILVAVASTGATASRQLEIEVAGK